jgi:hypothetical protein
LHARRYTSKEIAVIALHSTHAARRDDATDWVLAFVAGFLAVLVAHQPVLALLDGIGYVHAGVYSMHATKPLGVPHVISLAFWGGVWGLIFAAVEPRFPRGAGYWIAALVFGAIFPTLVAWFVVAAVKGAPLAAGGNPHAMVTGLVINGAWGIGTAILLMLGRHLRKAA